MAAALDRLKWFVYDVTQPGIDTSVTEERYIPKGKALYIRQVKCRIKSMSNFAVATWDVIFTLHQRIKSGVDPDDYAASYLHQFQATLTTTPPTSGVPFDPVFVWTPPVGYIIGGNLLCVTLDSTLTNAQVQAQMTVYASLVDKSDLDEIRYARELRTA